jgi:hypothetical protein
MYRKVTNKSTDMFMTIISESWDERWPLVFFYLLICVFLIFILNKLPHLLACVCAEEPIQTSYMLHSQAAVNFPFLSNLFTDNTFADD